MAQRKGTLQQRPWWHSPYLWIAIIAVFALSGTLTANFTVWSNPAVPSLPSFQREANQPAVQPVQQTPVVVAPVKERPKIHVEWTRIGTARNGEEVIALGMPRGDELISVPVELVENLPPGATGILGFPTRKGTVVLYTAIQTEPWVYTYWKTTTEIPLSAIEGLRP